MGYQGVNRILAVTTAASTAEFKSGLGTDTPFVQSLIELRGQHHPLPSRSPHLLLSQTGVELGRIGNQELCLGVQGGQFLQNPPPHLVDVVHGHAFGRAARRVPHEPQHLHEGVNVAFADVLIPFFLGRLRSHALHRGAASGDGFPHHLGIANAHFGT